MYASVDSLNEIFCKSIQNNFLQDIRISFHQLLSSEYNSQRSVRSISHGRHSHIAFN